MEAAMMEMNNLVHKMQTKVTYLENKLKSKQASHCKDESRRLHHHGTRWKKGLCTTCICKRGQIECAADACPTPSCPAPVPVEGECCPRC
ncbi:hypothetical protein C0Q70_17080 [Pomacea canaliculata]|uniref:VWFC domain-containing protein n=1 Tax=Pomacea canaliculata TaxID=400727 RepID=A0A2T7NRM1_POMCA|nr:hypothetical protein C0Q70_17080 [Pomacea canaliculata]